VETLAIVPAKHFANAKQRLALAMGDGARRALADAMLGDMLAALRVARAIDAVLVVSSDPRAHMIAEQHRARAIEEPAERGVNRAVAEAVGVARRLGAGRVLCVPADCPLMETHELETLLAQPRSSGRVVVIVPDRSRTGTNGLLLAPPDALQPRYGTDSFRRHADLARSAGTAAVVADVASLALDVDTPDDLAALRSNLAARAGRATRTRRLLDQIAAA
jgi:2-phospho-L-lactate guanylyltransferase